jgi:hypothetical protein
MYTDRCFLRLRPLFILFDYINCNVLHVKLKSVRMLWPSLQTYMCLPLGCMSFKLATQKEIQLQLSHYHCSSKIINLPLDYQDGVTLLSQLHCKKHGAVILWPSQQRDLLWWTITVDQICQLLYVFLCLFDIPAQREEAFKGTSVNGFNFTSPCDSFTYPCLLIKDFDSSKGDG